MWISSTDINTFTATTRQVLDQTTGHHSQVIWHIKLTITICEVSQASLLLFIFIAPILFKSQASLPWTNAAVLWLLYISQLTPPNAVVTSNPQISVAYTGVCLWLTLCIDCASASWVFFTQGSRLKEKPLFGTCCPLGWGKKNNHRIS